MKSPRRLANNARQYTPTSPPHHLVIKIMFIFKCDLQLQARNPVLFRRRCKIPAERKKTAVFHAFFVQSPDSFGPGQGKSMRADAGKIRR